MKTCFPVAALLGLLFVVALSPAVAAESNPFGLDLDKHPAEYDGCFQPEEYEPYWYGCKTVPKPHPEFELYAIQYVEGVGICAVTAVSKTIENDSYGFTTKRRVDAIAKQLKQKYGVETLKFDRLLYGSIWDDPDDWMMGVHQNERFYFYGWDSDKGFKPGGEVIELVVSAVAGASDAGNVRVEFYFKRQPQCDAIIEKAGQDAF